MFAVGHQIGNVRHGGAAVLAGCNSGSGLAEQPGDQALADMVPIVSPAAEIWNKHPRHSFIRDLPEQR